MDNMKYEEFVEQINQIPMADRGAFCESVLKDEGKNTDTFLAATFNLGLTYYFKGEFERAKEIIEPVMMGYQNYGFVREVISGFNFLGAIAYYDNEQELSRYYYNRALKIAQLNQKKECYASEYNNISLTYIEREDYVNALHFAILAKESLKESDDKMGAYVYGNLALSYYGLNRIEEAIQAYEYGFNDYEGSQILPDEYLAYGLLIYYKANNVTKYEALKQKALSSLDKIQVKQFIDVCKSLFVCGLDSKDYELTHSILNLMDQYLKEHPKDIKVGIMIEDFKYQYAKATSNTKEMLMALESQNKYRRIINEQAQYRKVQEID